MVIISKQNCEWLSYKFKLYFIILCANLVGLVFHCGSDSAEDFDYDIITSKWRHNRRNFGFLRNLADQN